MKRAAMLYCADVDAPRYKVLNARGQVPFLSNEGTGNARDGKYTLDEAFRLRLALDLMGGEGQDETQLKGLGPDYASNAIFNAMGYFPRHPLEQIEPGDWWAGVVVFQDDKEDGSSCRWSAWYVGEIEHLAAWVAEKAKREPGPSGENRGKSTVVRVFIANATRAADFVRDRAALLKLPEADFGHPVTVAAEA